jgi:hypothetical protein
MLPSGLVTELTDMQYEHNRYQLLEAVSGWQYGIENLQPAEWKSEARKWRREALRQYPTPEAYTAVCEALEKQRTRADASEGREKQVIELFYDTLGCLVMYTGQNNSNVTRIVAKYHTLYPDTPAPKEENTE